MCNFVAQSERKALSYWNKTKRYAQLGDGNVENFKATPTGFVRRSAISVPRFCVLLVVLLGAERQKDKGA